MHGVPARVDIRRGLRYTLLVDVADRDFSALVRHRDSNCFSSSLGRRRAGNQRDLVLELHRSSRCSCISEERVALFMLGGVSAAAAHHPPCSSVVADDEPFTLASRTLRQWNVILL
jgi:hypothetical protein